MARAGLFSLLILVVLLMSCDEPGTGAASAPVTSGSTAVVEQPAESDPSAIPPVAFTIVSTDDLSIKAMTQPLSTYTTAEIEALPTNTKLSYTATVQPTITTEQVRPTIDAIVDQARQDQPGADEVIVLLYSDSELVGGGTGYDVARGVWAPAGELGNVTSDIAQTDERTTYATSYDVREGLEAYLAQRGTDESRFGLSETDRREVFKALVAAEDRAMAEADQQLPIVAGATLEDINENTELYQQLVDEYKAAVRQEHGLTEEDALAISVEAFDEGWPLQ